MADRFGMGYNNGDGGGMDTFASPGGNTNFDAASPQSSQQVMRKATHEQTLVPVTIRMLLNSSNSTLADGREPHQIKLVAAIRSVNPSSTAYNYEVEDGTGFIEVKEWLDENDPLLKAQMRDEAAKEHQYVRIIGRLQVYDDKPSIVAYSVRKLSSGNELTHHFLEVVHSAERYKKANQIVGSPGMNGVMEMNTMSMGNGFNGNMPSSSVPIMQDNKMGGNALQGEIMQFLEGSGESGKDMGVFMKQYVGKYPEQVIKDMFEHLCTEGVIYSTTDENHYARI